MQISWNKVQMNELLHQMLFILFAFSFASVLPSNAIDWLTAFIILFKEADYIP